MKFFSNKYKMSSQISEQAKDYNDFHHNSEKDETNKKDVNKIIKEKPNLDSEHNSTEPELKKTRLCSKGVLIGIIIGLIVLAIIIIVIIVVISKGKKPDPDPKDPDPVPDPNDPDPVPDPNDPDPVPEPVIDQKPQPIKKEFEILTKPGDLKNNSGTEIKRRNKIGR